MTAIIASASNNLDRWRLTENRFRILILSVMCFAVMC
jgi:hypothetical protein